MFKEILNGNEKGALKYMQELINNGLDAKNFLNDILEVLYLFGRRISLGSIEKDMSISESEIQMVNQFSKNIDMHDIGLFWQLTIKTIDDLRIVGNENLSLEMFIMQLVHLKNIETTKEDEISRSENVQLSNENLIGRKNEESPVETNIPNQIIINLRALIKLKQIL